jgi:hypothetical protein
MKRKKVALLALTMAAVFAIAGVALGSVRAISPTVTLHAHADGSAIVAHGRYSYASTYRHADRKCHGVSGHPANLYRGKTFLGSGTTNLSGHYRVTTGSLGSGHYPVHTVVPGRSRGPYGGVTVCNDAVSRTVKVKIP